MEVKTALETTSFKDVKAVVRGSIGEIDAFKKKKLIFREERKHKNCMNLHSSARHRVNCLRLSLYSRRNILRWLMENKTIIT